MYFILCYKSLSISLSVLIWIYPFNILTYAFSRLQTASPDPAAIHQMNDAIRKMAPLEGVAAWYSLSISFLKASQNIKKNLNFCATFLFLGFVCKFKRIPISCSVLEIVTRNDFRQSISNTIKCRRFVNKTKYVAKEQQWLEQRWLVSKATYWIANV